MTAQASPSLVETPALRARSLRYVVPVGRVLLALIFILAGMSNFDSSTIAYAAAQGVPSPGLLVPLSGVLALTGGISIMLGYRTRLGAALLVLFLVPVTLFMHRFWELPRPEQMVQQAMFMKNLSILGGVLLVLYFGGGPLSMDGRLRARRA